MAMVNGMPESGCRPGGAWDQEAALERVHAAVAEGADIVDIGGGPARPDGDMDAREEIRRTVPVIAAARGAYPDLVISVDTRRPVVGREACAAGADLLADGGGSRDTGLIEVAAESGAGVVCSYAGPRPPRTRPWRTQPWRVAQEDDVLDGTLALAAHAVDVGVDPARILVDPARDLGQDTGHSPEIVRRLAKLVATGWPVLVSLSNQDLAGGTPDAAVSERAAGILAATAVCAWLGARVFRTRHVRQTRRVLSIVATIRGDIPPARAVRGLA